MHNPKSIRLIFTALLFLSSCNHLPAPVVLPTSQASTALAIAPGTNTPTAAKPLASKPPGAKPTITLRATPTPKLTSTPRPTATATPEVWNVLTVHLKPGLLWSDGTALAAKDLVGTYNILWAQKNSIWPYLKDVVARDDTTVDFLIRRPSARVVYQLLRTSPIAPASQYGQWMDQTGDARKAGFLPDSPEVQKVLEGLAAFKPETVTASGPFVLNPKTVSRDTIELIKNSNGYNAGKIDLNRIVVFYSRTTDAPVMVLYNKIDYSIQPYPSSEVARFESLPNLQVIYGPTGEDPGLWFNEAVYPLGKKEVRQAFAYVIDREQTAQAALGKAGKPVQYMAGFSDTQVNAWLTPQTIAGLDRYKKDWAKAEDLLKSAGCTRDAKGMWVDDKNHPMAYLVSVASGYDEWMRAAEDVAGQLKAFGIQATVQTYPVAERTAVKQAGRYQLLMDLTTDYLSSYPYPWFDYIMTKPANNPLATDNQFGMDWPWKQTGPDGKTVDIPTLLRAASDHLDTPGQKNALQTLALIENDQLPVLALYESYTAAPINQGTRVEGWLAPDNPIYENGQLADNPAAMQLLDGSLKKSAKGDGTFTTVWAYPHGTGINVNFFDAKSLVKNMGTFAQNVMYPPLFWYQWADGSYAPMLAESYEIK